eukprot:4983546-Pyramimonas_sp.AAC.1
MEVMEKGGFARIKVTVQVFYRKERQLLVIVHGDDYLAGGRRASLHWLESLIKGHIKVRVMPRVGNPGQGGV